MIILNLRRKDEMLTPAASPCLAASSKSQHAALQKPTQTPHHLARTTDGKKKVAKTSTIPIKAANSRRILVKVRAIFPFSF
jgi:hypothetical protein